MDRLQEVVEGLTPWKADVGKIESVHTPDDAELQPVYADLIELCDLYMGAGLEQQVTVRRMVASNRSVKKVLDSGWFLKNVSPDADYVKYLRLNLIGVSMTDGGFDFRDTIAKLKQWAQDARKRGIDPAPHYREIANISSDQASFSAKGLITQALS
jgi:hypothetical protein